MSDKAWRILIVEDLPIYVGLVIRMLGKLSAEIDAAGSLHEGLEMVRAKPYDVVVLDLGLPDSQGLDTFKTFKANCAEVPFIIFSGTEDEKIALQAVQLGAQDYLLKGSYLTHGEVGSSLLVRSITYAVERHRIQQELILERSLLEQRVSERTLELRGVVEQLQYELAERRRYESMINISQDPAFLVDASNIYQAVNNAYCQLHRLHREQIIGASVEDIEGVANFNAYFHPYMIRALAGQHDQFEGWLSFESDDSRYYDISFNPFFSSHDQVSHVVVVFHDETVRKQAEDRIRRHNFRLNILRQIEQTSLSSKSPQEIAKAALESFNSLVPYDRADVLILNKSPDQLLMVTGETDQEVVVRPAPGEIAAYFYENSTGFGAPFQVTSLQKQNDKNPYHAFLKDLGLKTNISIPLFAEGSIIGFLSLSSLGMQVFTEEHYETIQAISTPLALMICNSQLLHELGEANTHLRNLAAWLVSAQEDERHRISLELHDEAGQFLTALKLSLNMIEAELGEVSPVLQTQLQEANVLAAQIIDRLRTLAHDLRPPALDTVGLNQALQDYCTKISKQTGMAVNYRGVEVNGLPAHIQISLYRMAQEALTNVVKHAQAQTVEMKLEFDAEMVKLVVLDDGCGFALPSDPSIKMVGGIGLLGIQDRMEAIGGEFKIQSEPGNGTFLSAHVPL